MLADRLVVIAEETLAQAERTADQVRQQREAGRMAEFDLLRAQVARDTERPQVIRVRNERDLAYLRLKQLLDLPLDQPLQLVVDARRAGPAAACRAVGRRRSPPPKPAPKARARAPR